MKRGVLITLGVLLLLLGLALIAAGAAVATLLGPSGAVVSSPAKVSGSGVAIVADDVTVDAGSLPVPAGFGELTFSVRSVSGSAVFVGAAQAAQIDTYLAGAPYDVVVDLGGGRQATTRKVPGTQQPQPPATQAFWAMHASGAPATFSSVPAGTSLVIMNDDARSGIAAEVTARLTVRNAWTGAWTAVGVGALAVVIAVVCFWRARVARRRARADAASTALAVTPLAVTPLAATVLPEVTPVSVSHAVSDPGPDLAGPPESAPLVPDPVPGLAATTAASGLDSGDDETRVMTALAPVSLGDDTVELPAAPPVVGAPVDVTPDPDEPPAQGGSATLAALVAAASQHEHDTAGPESASGSEPESGLEHGADVEAGPAAVLAEPESEPIADQHAVSTPEAEVVHDDLAHDPDPTTDPVFAEIAERWGLLPADDPSADDPSAEEPRSGAGPRGPEVDGPDAG